MEQEESIIQKNALYVVFEVLKNLDAFRTQICEEPVTDEAIVDRLMHVAYDLHFMASLTRQLFLTGGKNETL